MKVQRSRELCASSIFARKLTRNCRGGHGWQKWLAPVLREAYTRRQAKPRFSPGIDLVAIWGTAKRWGTLFGVMRLQSWPAADNDLARAGQSIGFDAFH